MKEEIISLKVNDNDLVFKLRELTLGQWNEAVRKSSKTTMIANQPNVDVNGTLFSEWRLAFSIVEPAEYFGSLEKVRSLPRSTGMILLAKLDELDDFSPQPNSSSEKQ